MPFTFPEGLSPEVYPLAWLVGTWNGSGVIDHPAVGKRPFTQELTFDHDGGPYLRFESTLRVTTGEPVDGETGDAVWSTETGYWRVSTDRPEGLEEDRHPLEVVAADAAGRMTLYVGAVGNGRVDLASDAIARTSTSSDVRASKRLYGLVEGRLLWVEELAAFGEPLRSYASGELDRQ
ncbi:FABP family protein [Myceligenerans pegani]|uniref:Ferric nitrobindin-like protein n=1 Tax=Myceligenerans pegani TaxID=2776917 RepID=A0ABR9MUR6_9MICO|nr:FABP family protein [Myceligenerans sp. TRM 65318]MBE1875127.1 FABP family protein [Myceligenerans sp. TRM 65318]MBE3017398.1 FABP family protein [Myceligenerans sp. TRM 65318]